MSLFMIMKIGRIFLTEFLKKEVVKVLQISVRIETNDSHQKMWREWSNIGLKVELALARSCFFRTG